MACSPAQQAAGGSLGCEWIKRIDGRVRFGCNGGGFGRSWLRFGCGGVRDGGRVRFGRCGLKFDIGIGRRHIGDRRC